MSSLQPIQKSASLHAPWLLTELWRRVLFMWGTKMLTTAGGIAVFFWLYFQVMAHPIGIPRPVFLTPIDLWIKPADLLLIPYGSLWLYISLSAALLGSRLEVQAFGLAAGSMALLGLAIFWVFPSYALLGPFDLVQHPWIALLRETDFLGNACPSLHVAYALFSGCLLQQQMRLMCAPAWWRSVNAAWCAVIIYSTVATRQHAVLDVVGGLAFGWIFWNVYLCRLPRGHLLHQAIRRRLKTAP